MVKRAILAKDRDNKQSRGAGALVGCEMSARMATTEGVSRSLPGCLMFIGGAEDRASDCWLLQAFAELCGGAGARIILITTALGGPAQTSICT